LVLHPRRKETSCCYRCRRGQLPHGEYATVIEREVFRFTPGCFKDGGAFAVRPALVIYCECRQRAKNIVGMFKLGALNEDDPVVIIGADPRNIHLLNLLDEHITKTNNISCEVIERLTQSSGVFHVERDQAEPGACH
jgi:hypothetical protein